MLKNHLHTAVILATAAVAPLSLEANVKSLFCHTTEDQRTATVQAPAAKTSLKSKLMRLFGRNKTQRATIIPAKNNTADSKEAKFLWTQPGLAAHRSQHGLPPRENKASAETLFLTPPPANTQKKSVRFDTQTTSGFGTPSLTPPPAVKQEEDTSSLAENKAPAPLSPAPTPVNVPTKTPSPAPRPMTELFTDPLNLLASVSVDIKPVKNHETPPQTTESSVDSIRWSTILETISPFLTSPQQSSLDMISEEPEAQTDVKTQAAQLKAELASLSESIEEAQQRTESPEEVSVKDPKKAQFDPVIAQLSQQFADKQQIPENPQN